MYHSAEYKWTSVHFAPYDVTIEKYVMTYRFLQLHHGENYGARAIQTLGAQLWNELPLELRVLEEHGAFHKNLKTLLFKREYALWI